MIEENNKFKSYFLEIKNKELNEKELYDMMFNIKLDIKENSYPATERLSYLLYTITNYLSIDQETPIYMKLLDNKNYKNFIANSKNGNYMDYSKPFKYIYGNGEIFKI